MHPLLLAIKEARNAQNSTERFTPFSDWYKGAHARSRAHTARAVKKAIKEFKTSDPDLTEKLVKFLDSHTAKNTNWDYLKEALESCSP